MNETVHVAGTPIPVFQAKVYPAPRSPGASAVGIRFTVLRGDQDYLDPEATSWRSLARANTAVEINVLTGAGHYAWIDAPAEFTRTLSHGLGRVRRSR